MNFKKTFRALAFALLGVAGGQASAAVVTVSGANVDYSFDDALLGLFGNYSIAGDTLSFDPTTFIANATGTGIVVTSATTPTITVTAKSGVKINAVSLFEQGDYFMINDGGTTLVAASGQFIVDNAPNAINAGGLTAAQSPADVGANGLTTTTWTISKSVALSDAASTTLKLQNILVAGISGGMQAAFIEKKLVQFSVETAPVPVPPAVWMLGSAIVGLATVGRRKQV